MPEITTERPIAYFCAEYGFQGSWPLYAGGLGVLAGDTVKEAADQRLPFTAVGLFYRGGMARQVLDQSGWQSEQDVDIDPVEAGFEHVYVPLEEQPLFVRVHLTKVDVWARVWRKRFGNVSLYLLDTDTDQNEKEERDIAKALYFGSEEDLIKQQMILGIGGVKLLDALEIHPSIYHVNEGRPAFLFWQLTRRFMEQGGLEYQEAAEKARSMIVYTNHTLVRAGNQSYDTDLIRQYSQYYADKMGVTIDELLKPGLEEETGKFNITQFALRTSHKASSVSQPHFELSRSLWPEFEWVNITNGVHLPTWQDEEVKNCDLNGDDLWQVHLKKKRELMEFVHQRSGFGYDPDRLVVSWARRIATYKRLQTLLEDVEQLAEVLKKSGREIQLLIAGKAHAKDTAGKQVLKDLIEAMQGPLAGNAIFIPNYDIDVARMLVKGSDVWLNTPIQGQEASGTSGMKAAVNGALQLTVEDGWTAEVNWHEMGWTLDNTNLTETLIFRLDKDVAPAFYERNEGGVPEEWLARMKKTIQLADQYGTHRMMREYKEKLYQS